jgi:chromosome segregation ATPase
MPTRKKSSKKTKKSTKKLEKELDVLENNIDNLEKASKKPTKEQKQEIERKNAVEEKIDIIREDLRTQLLNQSKLGKHFEDMVEDYIFFVRLKEDLQQDIRDNGLRYKSMTGNGYPTEKPNESVKNLKDINAQMLKILQELDLKEPDEGPKVGDDEDDLLS